VAGVAIAIVIARRCRRRSERARGPCRVWPLALIALAGLPLIAWQMTGATLTLAVPQLAGFDFRSGGTMTPELAALVIGLTTYSSAFVAEIVRAGIQGVPGGQREAAAALGLRPGATLRLVVLPQALRIIVLPM